MPPHVANRRELNGWLAYDWANSAFQTTIITVLSGPYLTALAQAAVGANGVVLRLGPLGSVTAKSLFPYCIALSVFLQVLLLPVIGAIADYTRFKKLLMILFCYAGVAAAGLLFFATADRYIFGAALLVVANVAYGATIVLYNSFLNDITTVDQRDKVSSQGYAIGYLGGGLLLALNLVLINQADRLGISRALAVRLSMLSAALWWGLFAVITFTRLGSRPPRRVLSPHERLNGAAFTELRRLWHDLRRLPQTLRYLIAYMSFNDGIQTVIAIASVFLAQELFVARGLEPRESFLVGLILMVQFIAFAGALAFERIAVAIGTKRAILLSLLVWTAVILYAYAWLGTLTQAWVMGGVIALVLGGSQALSRSLFSRMIPAGHEAAFFGVYEITERGTSWVGPLVFGAVVGATGSYRSAMLSLIVLFGAGIALLAFTDTDRAMADAAR